MPRFAPRIHVLLARDANVGVVLRRGPSKQVASLLWDRRRDEFRLGQWLKGRIYERRSDISPDGKYLIYFAMNGKWTSEARGAWTAISKAPYLKALAIFAKGDCWHGGGIWTTKSSYWLNDGLGHTVLRDTAAAARDRQFQPEENYGGECPGVYYHRLIRDGWVYVEHSNIGKWKDIDIFEKRVPKGWVLRKIAHAETDAPAGKGCYWDEHLLIGPGATRTIACPTWEWADLDGKRLVWASEGKLHAACIEKTGLVDECLLHDFNEMSFSPIEAPY